MKLVTRFGKIRNRTRDTGRSRTVLRQDSQSSRTILNMNNLDLCVYLLRQ